MSEVKNIEWYALGYLKNRPEHYNNYTPIDWNQTLISKINECSAKILESSFNCADTIEISPNIEGIFDTLIYYNRHTRKLGESKKVIINPNSSSMVKVYNSCEKSNYRIIEVTGLSEPFKYEEVLDVLEYKYLLLRYGRA